MPIVPKIDFTTIDAVRNLNLDPQLLVNLKPIVLTDIESARKLGVTVRDLDMPLVLSPNKPLVNKSFLSFYSPMMLLADPRDTNNIALFSSAYPAVSYPTVQVGFFALKPGKKHLVEFNITINEPSKVYKFRVFKYPGNYQDISISTSQSIDVIMDTTPDATYSYGVSIAQQNSKAEACGWIFHSVKITSIN